MKKVIVIVISLLFLNAGLSQAQTQAQSQAQTQAKIQTTLTEYTHPDGRQIVLVNFNQEVTAKYALEEIEKLKLKPAKLEEMESFLYMQYDQNLKNTTIVAIGSSWQTVVCRIMIPYSSQKGPFNLHWIEDKWNKGSLFMTFKK